MRRAALALTLLAAPMMMAGSAVAQSPDTLRVSINADIRTNDPGVNRDGNTDAVMMHVLEGLVGLTETGDVAPLLAAKVDVSPDGKAYTFTLRDGLVFHNGQPVTSADVAWSWKRYLDPATKWRCLSEFDGKGLTRIEAVETPDAKTVVFRLDKPTALFLSVMARPDCGGSAILHKDSVDADGKWKGPIATGPFKFGEWKRSQYIELERFAAYQSLPGPRNGYVGGKKVEVERVRFLVIPDPSAIKAALMAGSIDVSTDVTAEDVAELKRRGDITVETAPTMSVSAFLLQTRDPVLQDVRVRRAIAHAIDTAEIATGITQGTAKPNASIVPTPSSYYSPAQAQRAPHDPALAKKLLAEAGYRGQPIKILANKRYGAMYDAAVLAQAMMQQVGIAAELEVLEWATQLDRYLKGDYQMMSFSYSARLDAALNYEMMTGPKDKQPRKIWDNPAAQKLLDEAMVVADRGRRQAIFDQLHAMFLADTPMLVLYNGVDISASSKRASGYKGWAAGQPRLWGVSLQ
ncbi:peptide/nickel transport system substrate-binding protein [Stella humosa]|uniref:Peptide/nickel transport system substrate-binding protein n=1 Tax=Stella humosa TaxID=94 RepID=A0A3N1LJ66_9PROT|nr:ABC transporter substrate-binding protein [Stella humosa]ROP90898.1 peptide/nickel transport system substrate-binding protein [Stella humosa]BBK34752.1 peptide ABC transporter substrate-binding protein [Stella humosa]